MTTDVLSDTDVSLKVVSNASGRMRVCVTGFNVDAVRAVAIEETVSQVTGCTPCTPIREQRRW
ncbi:metal cation transporter P-type ATPase CtpV [Mycobacterium tuberculosis]|nr:metal cation transporter P-type ATPase CtpV [Mycobacterium tuberculosis]